MNSYIIENDVYYDVYRTSIHEVVMAIKIRKQIYIESDQNTILKRLSKERGMPEAEIIREAITQHVQGLGVRRRDLRAWEAERDFIDRLSAQTPTPEPQMWRREELHER
jgi:hypothetical protein